MKTEALAVTLCLAVCNSGEGYLSKAKQAWDDYSYCSYCILTSRMHRFHVCRIWGRNLNLRIWMQSPERAGVSARAVKYSGKDVFHVCFLARCWIVWRVKRMSSWAVLLFKPKHRWGHPEHYLLTSSKNKSGSEYPKIVLFNFGNRSINRKHKSKTLALPPLDIESDGQWRRHRALKYGNNRIFRDHTGM